MIRKKTVVLTLAKSVRVLALNQYGGYKDFFHLHQLQSVNMRHQADQKRHHHNEFYTRVLAVRERWLLHQI